MDAWGLFTALAGPVVGSFVGLVSIRLPAGKAWIWGRSRCASCERSLRVIDLAPLLSYAVSQGRCRSCGASIPWRYPVTEAGCLAIGVVSALGQSGPAALATALLGWWLLLIALLDAEHFWLPDLLTIPLGLAGLALTIGALGQPPLPQVIGAIVGYGALALIAKVYEAVRGREGLGGGDPRLLGAIGAWVGWEALPSVLIWACAAGLSLVAAKLIARRRFDPAAALPFGVFLAIGAWLTWWTGPLHRLYAP
ncbi:MAG: A24 family peptidase [Pseudomonadota bacterium]